MRDFVPDDFIPEPDAVHGVPDDARAGEAIPEELVDAFFDGELDGEDTRSFIRELRNDAPTAKKVVSLNSALEALRRPVSTPDFTASVMDEVDGRTPWLSTHEFKLLGHWRAVAAVCALCLITAAFVTQRVAPGAASFTQQDAPVTRLTQTIPSAANGIGQTFDVSFTKAQQLITEPSVSTPQCKSRTWCFDEFSKELMASGCVIKASECATAGPADDAPSCMDECGAVQMRTRNDGTLRIVGTPSIINASSVPSGAVIIK